MAFAFSPTLSAVCHGNHVICRSLRARNDLARPTLITRFPLNNTADHAFVFSWNSPAGVFASWLLPLSNWSCNSPPCAGGWECLRVCERCKLRLARRDWFAVQIHGASRASCSWNDSVRREVLRAREELGVVASFVPRVEVGCWVWGGDSSRNLFCVFRQCFYAERVNFGVNRLSGKRSPLH